MKISNQKYLNSATTQISLNKVNDSEMSKNLCYLSESALYLRIYYNLNMKFIF